MTKHTLEEALGAVWAANLRGYLYLHPHANDVRERALQWLVRSGALVEVPGTGSSLPGYAAVMKPGEALASPVRRALA